MEKFIINEILSANDLPYQNWLRLEHSITKSCFIVHFIFSYEEFHMNVGEIIYGNLIFNVNRYDIDFEQNEGFQQASTFDSYIKAVVKIENKIDEYICICSIKGISNTIQIDFSHEKQPMVGQEIKVIGFLELEDLTA